MADNKQHTDESLVNEGVAFESKDLKLGWLAGSAIIILLLTLGAMGLLVAGMAGMESVVEQINPTPLPLLDARPTPPAPRLQPNPIDRTTAEEEIATYNSQTDRILTRFGWVDKEAGIVRIPINVAIDVLAPPEPGVTEPER